MAMSGQFEESYRICKCFPRLYEMDIGQYPFTRQIRISLLIYRSQYKYQHALSKIVGVENEYRRDAIDIVSDVEDTQVQAYISKYLRLHWASPPKCARVYLDWSEMYLLQAIMRRFPGRFAFFKYL